MRITIEIEGLTPSDVQVNSSESSKSDSSKPSVPTQDAGAAPREALLDDSTTTGFNPSHNHSLNINTVAAGEAPAF